MVPVAGPEDLGPDHPSCSEGVRRRVDFDTYLIEVYFPSVRSRTTVPQKTHAFQRSDDVVGLVVSLVERRLELSAGISAVAASRSEDDK